MKGIRKRSDFRFNSPSCLKPSRLLAVLLFLLPLLVFLALLILALLCLLDTATAALRLLPTDLHAPEHMKQQQQQQQQQQQFTVQSTVLYRVENAAYVALRGVQARRAELAGGGRDVCVA